MAYFSNGTEGECYREQFCNCCVHDDAEKGCPIWNAHFLYAYTEHGKPAGEVLDMLIPMEPHTFKDGLSYKVAGKCRFFERASLDLPFAEKA